MRVNGAEAQAAGKDTRGDLAWLRVELSGPAVKLRAQRAALGEPVAVPVMLSLVWLVNRSRAGDATAMG